MTTEELGFMVAEVKVIKEVELDNRILPVGSIATVSILDHPTDVKLWANGQYQASPDYFDLKNPVKIIRTATSTFFKQ